MGDALVTFVLLRVLLSRLLPLALVALANSSPARAQSRSKVIDSLMAPYAVAGGPGASVLVVARGRVVVTRSYGLADVERDVHVTPATNFRLASLTKQMTATAIMLLAAEGTLAYDDDITKWVSGLPAYARGVTIRQLLTHTGGLPDYEDFVPDSQTAQVHDADIPALISRAPAPRFAAGTKYEYSNSGYVLLALAVERASGQRFADFLGARSFKPLGMSQTLAFEEGTSTVPHRAWGYTFGTTGIRRTDQSNTSATLGDGGVYANVIDLAKWDRALRKHTLVSAKAQALAWSPPSLSSGVKSEYGFGWFVDNDHGEMRLRHHGESRGFTNGVVRYPASGVTVFILTNRTGGAPWDIAQRIADLYLPARTDGPARAWKP